MCPSISLSSPTVRQVVIGSDKEAVRRAGGRERGSGELGGGRRVVDKKRSRGPRESGKEGSGKDTNEE